MYIFPNHKKYVGKTMRSLAARQGHNFVHYKNNKLLWNAIQKYGVENIQQDILVEADMEDHIAAEIEKEYVALWHTNCLRYTDPSFGYNFTDGGDGTAGWTLNEERRKAAADQLRSVVEKSRGVPLSEEHKEKIRRAHAGKKLGPMSEEHKQKISIAAKKAHMSPETKARRSYIGKKKMYVINKKTGERIDFDSMKAAAEYFGVSTPTIRRCIEVRVSPRFIDEYVFYLLSTDND